MCSQACLSCLTNGRQMQLCRDSIQRVRHYRALRLRRYCRSAHASDPLTLMMRIAFSAFRVWAIWGRELRPFLIVLPFCLATPVFNLVSHAPLPEVSHQADHAQYRVARSAPFWDDSLPPPWGGCLVDVSISPSLSIMYVRSAISPWNVLFIFA